MKLNLESLKNTAAWQEIGVALPKYDAAEMAQRTKDVPVWLHFGAGNLFRGYVARLAQTLLNEKLTDRGVIAVDASDGDLVRRIYQPHDNLTLLALLHAGGSVEREIIASVAEAVHADFGCGESLARLKALFRAPSLQMVSYTITEKGYAIRDGKCALLPAVQTDLENGPEKATHVMSKTAALLLERYLHGAAPIAMVSMDNCSQNGDKLRSAVLDIASEWVFRGFAPEGFLDYLKDESLVSFPWSMIDKIVPRPDSAIEQSLTGLGIEGMDILPRAKGAAIAPFVNAETAEYLVIEDRFPNGRPPLEKAGVFLTDRNTVSLAERMKVTVCLNPLHTALATLGCAMGYTRIWEEMKDATLVKLISRIGAEGLPLSLIHI